MSERTWLAVERYFDDLFCPSDEVLDDVSATAEARGLPPISVSPSQGKFLHLLARMRSATRILEIGTLGGYSTIWMARALPPEGRLVTLEADPAHADVARINFARAGLEGMIDLRVGPALETLPVLAAEGAGPFDLVFIDADKANNAEYFSWSLKMSRKGTVIVLDNIARGGDVADPESRNRSVRGVREFSERVAAEPRVSGTAIQTVGSKGYDGFAMVLVTEDAGG